MPPERPRAPARAKAGPKGRYWVAFWLVLFVAVAGVIVARQSASLALARQLGELGDQRAELDARRADLDRRIRRAGSREVLVRRAADLGLHAAADSEYTVLQVPRAAGNR